VGNLVEAHLDRAILSNSDQELAGFHKAHLDGAYLGYAYLDGVVFVGAHLANADLKETDLTPAQVLSAHEHGEALCFLRIGPPTGGPSSGSRPNNRKSRRQSLSRLSLFAVICQGEGSILFIGVDQVAVHHNLPPTGP
jgi:uncharacterized protein YjbI with pentapeptide repeats